MTLHCCETFIQVIRRNYIESKCWLLLYEWRLQNQSQENPVTPLLNSTPIKSNLGILTVDLLRVENSFYLFFWFFVFNVFIFGSWFLLAFARIGPT